MLLSFKGAIQNVRYGSTRDTLKTRLSWYCASLGWMMLWHFGHMFRSQQIWNCCGRKPANCPFVVLDEHAASIQGTKGRRIASIAARSVSCPIKEVTYVVFFDNSGIQCNVFCGTKKFTDCNLEIKQNLASALLVLMFCFMKAGGSNSGQHYGCWNQPGGGNGLRCSTWK
jgi:hypothetical protein